MVEVEVKVMVVGVGVSGCRVVMVVSFTIIVGTLNLDVLHSYVGILRKRLSSEITCIFHGIHSMTSFTIIVLNVFLRFIQIKINENLIKTSRHELMYSTFWFGCGSCGVGLIA